MSRSLFRGTANYALARGIPGLVNFAALALFTRLLSERDYGVYALTVAGVSLVFCLSLQWLGPALLRLLHLPGRSRVIFLATALRVFVGIGLPVALAIALIGPVVVRPLPSNLLIVGAVLFLGQAWLDLNLGLANADSDPRRYGRLAALRAVGGLTGGGLAAWLGGGAIGVVGGIAAGYVIAGAASFGPDWRAAVTMPPSPSMRAEIFRYGLPLAGTYALDFVVSSSDRLLLGTMVSPAAAGLYAPAYDLCQQTLWALMMVVNLAAYPLSVRAMDMGDSRERDHHFRQHFVLLVGISLPAATGLAVLAPSMSGLLGANFAGSARALLPILAAALLLGGIKSYYFDLGFQLGRSTSGQFLTVAIAASVNLLLNLVLIPRLGGIGAAYATLIAYSVALCISWALGRRSVELPIPRKDLGRIILATLAMIGVLLPLREWTGPIAVLTQVFVGASVYLALAIIFRIGELRVPALR